ncbi:hypothetical protein OIU80_19750 [Flavobacterium sp. LS1R47]|uniref:Uncharacterized protein n=1 Tax=Flavobacterium frigoritolerans TaxID=2987686 RepID=A0A9X3HN63_9FLAO|nr:hypothetical protein [Flavobacterium frigoritolerans]MCV9934521.1 hypothetical protein [Flavobacterium frigoritolerans]
MSNQRIKLNDSTMGVVAKMSDNNFGAIDVLMMLLQKETDNIDPDNFMGGLGVILYLDTLGIYGTDIYVLYNDICDRNLVEMLSTIRATQLGMFPSNILVDACGRQDYSGKKLIPVDELYLKVKERLPRFNEQK